MKIIKTITTQNVLYHNPPYHAINFKDAGKSFFHADLQNLRMSHCVTLQSYEMKRC